MTYREEYDRWAAAPVAFWAQQANNIEWFKPPTITQARPDD